MELSRRALLKGSVGILGYGSLAPPQAQDPLSSWNAGPTKQRILDFVRASTDQSSKNFLPPAERIATFDQDGTLWVEHPMYTQVVYALERVPTVVKAKPDLANVEPFKTVISGSREAIAKLSMDELLKILEATLTGMSVDDFRAEVKRWLVMARDLRWKKPYTKLAYAPMLELLRYMRVSNYRTYIVTGGAQDFVRVFADQVYGIPPEQVVGTASGISYEYDTHGRPFLTKDPKLLLNDNNAGKPEGVHLMIGRRPLRSIWQFDGGSANAGAHESRRRRTASDAGAARRRPARIRLRSCAGVARHHGWDVHPSALR